MESTSNQIKQFTSNIFDKVSSVKRYIFVTVAIVLIVAIGYFLSYDYRTSLKYKEILKKHKSNIVFQTDYCHPEYLKYTLCDFHIKSSHNTAAAGFKKYDYISLDMIYNVLKLGTRYLEFEIFAKEQNTDSIPVVSVGSKKGDWKMTANVLNCEDVFSLIAQNAFSEKLLRNTKDPLFIFLNIKTDNKLVLNKLSNILTTNFKLYLLDKRYQYQRMNISTEKVCNLLEKVVIMSSSGYVDTDLERLINISTDSPFLERVIYSDLIVHNKFNINQPDFLFSSNKISFHKGISNDYIQIHDYNVNLQEMNITKDMKVRIGNSKFPQNRTKDQMLTIDNITDKKISFKKHESISFRKEEKGEVITIKAYSMNEKAKDIEEVNKYRLTIVVPDYDLFSANFNPKNIWYTGSQFVALNFQSVDDNMKIYLKFFQKRALKLKQSSLLKTAKDVPENNNFPTNKVNKDLQSKFRSDCEEIEPDVITRTTTSQLSEADLEAKLADYKEEVKQDRIYNINYDFMKKNLDINLFFTPVFNPNLRLVKDNEKLRMTLEYFGDNFIFQVITSKYRKNVNSVRIYINQSFLSVNNNGELRFVNKDSSEAQSHEFLKRSSFLLLNSLCGKPDTCSIGYVIDKDIGKNQTTPVLNYLMIKNYFSTKNKLYKYRQTRYKKILTLHGGEVEIGSETETLENYTIWRPLSYKDFKTTGDIILKGDSFIIDNILTETEIVCGATKHPIGYEMVHKYEQSGTNKTESFVIWKPIAPDGFLSMGFVVVKNGEDTPPPKNTVVCVGANFVTPAEAEIDDNKEVSRFRQSYFNKEISFWTGKNHKYFVPTNFKKKSYDALANTSKDDVFKFTLEPPFEFDNPIYDFVNLATFTDDLVYLTDDVSNISAREAVCFKYTINYKSGEFTEYNLYNGLNDIPDQDGKIISFVRGRNGAQQCVSLPNSYWSPYYSQISKQETETTTEDTGNYLNFNKYNTCPEDNKHMLSSVLATEDDCFKIGGYMTDSEKFNSTLRRDKTGKCILDMCKTKTEDTIYLNRKGVCRDKDRLGHAKVKVSYNDCYNMGGEYLGEVEDPDKIVNCKVDVCKKPTDFDYKIPFNETTFDVIKDKRELARLNLVPVQAANEVSRKCNEIHESNYDGSLCDVPLFYNSGLDTVDLELGPCRDKSYFGTSFVSKDDNTIRLRDNTDYCLTIPLDRNRAPVTEKLKDPTKGGLDNTMKIATCKASREGQQFIKSGNQLKYYSNKDGTTDLCVTNEVDNSLRLAKCNNLANKQNWIFKNMPNDYCIGENSIVYFLKKKERQRKDNVDTENAINLPVENLLQEDYDYNFIHMFIKGEVTSVNNTSMEVKNIKYPDKDLERFSKSSEMDKIVLAYKPPLDKLIMGTKVIAKNGGYNNIKDTYTEGQVMWYGVIVEKLKNGNYKVFFSINSIEPDQNNKKCGRPDYSMVKELSLDDMYLLKVAPFC